MSVSCQASRLVDFNGLIAAPPSPRAPAESWSEWSDWSECDVAGVQVRVRQCVLLFPVGSQCSGNTTESRPCIFDSNFIPGEGAEMLVSVNKITSNVSRGSDSWVGVLTAL